MPLCCAGTNVVHIVGKSHSSSAPSVGLGRPLRPMPRASRSDRRDRVRRAGCNGAGVRLGDRAGRTDERLQPDELEATNDY